VVCPDFPELKSWRETGLDSGDPPSNYAFVGFVFKPQFKQELEKGALTDFLARSAEFIEQVCRSGDAEAVNVIWIKIFEWLLPRPTELRILWPALGEKTKLHIKDAASRWAYSLDKLEK